MFEEVRNSLGDLPQGSTHDRLRVEAALHIWRKHSPNLLLIHLVVYDDLAHRFGPLSSQALAALERTDEEVARVQNAIGRSAAFVVLSDHGFLPVEKDVAPHVALVEEGLLGRNGSGALKLRKLGAIHAGGSFAAYWLQPPTGQDREALERAVKRIAATGAVAEIVDRKKLRALGADPDAELILDAAPGFLFSDRSSEPLVRESVDGHGTHGHLPSHPGLEACFVALGQGIPHAKNLGRVHLTQIAPTLANLLGLRDRTLPSDAPALDLT